MACACGIPNLANVHYFVIIDRPAETDYHDIYLCTGHDPGTEDREEWQRVLFAGCGNTWEVLEVTRTEIR